MGAAAACGPDEQPRRRRRRRPQGAPRRQELTSRPERVRRGVGNLCGPLVSGFWYIGPLVYISLLGVFGAGAMDNMFDALRSKKKKKKKKKKKSPGLIHC